MYKMVVKEGGEVAKFDEEMGQKVGEITEDETFTKHGWLAFVPSMFLTAWGSVEGGANGMISAPGFQNSIIKITFVYSTEFPYILILFNFPS